MKLEEFIGALKDKKTDDYLLLVQKLKESQEIIQEIIDVLEHKNDSELSDSICEAFFTMYTDKIGSESYKVCLQFIPAIIWAYYCQLSKKGKSKPETLLLAFYNQCVQKNIETPFTNAFRIPTITKPSVFHEPFMLASSALTENTLNQHERFDKPILFKGPSKYLDRIPAGLRCTVLAAVLQEFNFSLSMYPRSTLISFCSLVLRLSLCGYNLTDVDYPNVSKESLSALSSCGKVRLSGKSIQEMVTALQFASFNGVYEEAQVAVKCLHQHCRYSLPFAGTLNTNALRNLLQLSAMEDEKNFEMTPPINPQNCCFRGKGKSSIIGSQRPMFPRSLSIDRVLSAEDSNVSVNPSKSLISPSNISITIDSPKVSPSTSVVNNETSGQQNVKIELFTGDNDDVSVTTEDGNTCETRRSTYTDEESEFENDKTPLINGSLESSSSNKQSDIDMDDQSGTPSSSEKNKSPKLNAKQKSDQEETEM